YRTLSELQEENFLTPVHAWAREHGVAFRVQNYGRPPARVSGYGCADLIEGEGWGWRGIPETRWASSAAHHLGRPVVSSETWTWVNSPAFRARPIDLKGEAHEHLLLGVNQLIGHGGPFSPRDAVDPGWAFYAAGALSDRNAWWPAAPALFGYLTRLSALLRTGEHVADVGLWLPYEDAYAGFGPDRPADLWRASVAQIGDQVPAMLREAGYDFDVTDAQTPVESITRRHRVVVLAGSTILSAQDAEHLRAIAAAGCPRSVTWTSRTWSRSDRTWGWCTSATTTARSTSWSAPDRGRPPPACSHVPPTAPGRPGTPTAAPSPIVAVARSGWRSHPTR